MYRRLKNALQEVRLKMRPFYWGLDFKYRMEPVDSRIAVSTKYHFLYYRIPKSANSTVLRTLISYEDSDFASNYNSSLAKKKFYKRPSQLSYFTARKAKRSYFKFTVVRNPYSRLVSAFLQKIEANLPQTVHVRKQLGFTKDKPISFEQFVGYLENGGIYQDPHWAPQTLLLPQDRSLVDYIGRVESLTEDMNHIIKQIHPSKPFQGLCSYVSHQTNATEKLKKFYSTQDIINRIRTLYRQDFEMFGYRQTL